MDLTHTFEMTEATAQAWQALKQDSRGVMAKLPRHGEQDAIFMSSRVLAVSMGWRHCNMLRTLKRFIESHPKDPGWLKLQRGSTFGGAILWLPTLQRFIVWLLKELEGHEADQLRRRDGFLKSLGWFSGLRKRSADEGLAVEGKAMWVLEIEQDKLIWEPAEAYQFSLDLPTSAKTNDNVHLTQLSCQCGYSLRHMERHIKAARHEFEDLADPDFLTVSSAGLVSAKTAMFVLLSMPKTLRARLKIFNCLYSLTQKKPLTLPPDLPNYLVGTDFADPEKALNACLIMYKRTQAQHAFHNGQRSYWDQDEQKLKAEMDILRAELAGKDKQVAEMKTSLMQAKAAGSLIREPTEDTAIYHSGKLRSMHGWITLRDAERAIATHLGYGNIDVLLADLGLAKLSSRGAAIRRVVKYTLCQKNNRADGRFVLNQVTYDNEYADVKRVYVPAICSTGHRASHGTDRDWRWQLFITPKGLQYLESKFAVLAQAFVDAGCPDHAQAQEVEEV